VKSVTVLAVLPVIQSPVSASVRPAIPATDVMKVRRLSYPLPYSYVLCLQHTDEILPVCQSDWSFTVQRRRIAYLLNYYFVGRIMTALSRIKTYK